MKIVRITTVVTVITIASASAALAATPTAMPHTAMKHKTVMKHTTTTMKKDHAMTHPKPTASK
jgi:hypothetical protein